MSSHVARDKLSSMTDKACMYMYTSTTAACCIQYRPDVFTTWTVKMFKSFLSQCPYALVSDYTSVSCGILLVASAGILSHQEQHNIDTIFC